MNLVVFMERFATSIDIITWYVTVGDGNEKFKLGYFNTKKCRRCQLSYNNLGTW